MSASVSQPIQLPAGEVVLTASMGVALVHGEYRGAETVLKDAEIALYEAKRQGYGAIEYFRSDMHDERSQLLQLEQNLRHALERNEIEVVYQPIVRLADRKLAGFEALMRWRRGDSILEPDGFISLAEETGLIRELGRHVLKEASSRLGTWQRAFRRLDPLFVAVNISSVQLLNNDLVEDVGRLMEREDLQPGTLKLELTESLVVENPELARKLLVRLKQMGVALACDDFGTGYSGLESVFRLPFDTVKLDRVFLEAENGERNWEMVEAMLRLAHDLGLEVVAEGIETDEQMERLSRLGCDYGQGYLIGPPVTAQQVIAALGGHSHEPAGLGTGLAAFWNRLTGASEAGASEAGEVAAQPLPPSEAPVAEPGTVEDPDVREDVEDEPVIDVRGIMAPAGTLATSNPPASQPDVPEVGAAPFAPRRVKPPEPRLPEISPFELTLPKIMPEPVATQEAPVDESGPVEITPPPGSIGLEKAERREPEAVAADVDHVPPSEARRSKRKKSKENKAGPIARKGRRNGKTAHAKVEAAKSQSSNSGAKTSGAKTSGAKTSGPRPRGPRLQGPRLQRPRLQGPSDRRPRAPARPARPSGPARALQPSAALQARDPPGKASLLPGNRCDVVGHGLDLLFGEHVFESWHDVHALPDDGLHALRAGLNAIEAGGDVSGRLGIGKRMADGARGFGDLEEDLLAEFEVGFVPGLCHASGKRQGGCKEQRGWPSSCHDDLRKPRLVASVTGSGERPP
jgi:EAL domain-containing protein (putative c-di-GMP-specific phosphodiesterase class I)